MNDIMKIVRTLEDSGILLKEQKGGFLLMLLGTLGASLLGDLLTKNLSGKEVRSGKKLQKQGEDFQEQGKDCSCACKKT